MPPSVRFRRRARTGAALATGLALAAVVLLGCGGDDEDGDGPLPIAAAVYPADGATGVPPRTALLWSADEAPVKALDHYRIFLGGGPTVLSHHGISRGTSYVLEDLALDATYWWAIEAVGEHGATRRGGPWSFTTLAALDGPVVTRFVNGEAWDAPDTVGFGHPIAFSWSAASPLAAQLPPAALALLDTVPPADGILGYQYGFATESPIPPQIWRPRDDEGVVYFGDVQEYALSSPPAAGLYWFGVAALDFAGGVTIATDAAGPLVVNFDPDTVIDRTRTYPYYVVFHGPEAGQYNFADGDTVPDGAYVVVRAIGWDDPRDEPLPDGAPLRLQGAYRATGLMFGSVPYPFFATYSEPVEADTLGFLVGPFSYAVTMRAVDEHGRRDGTPDTLRFHANFPPCVQCVELLNLESSPTFAADGPCGSSCLDESTVLTAPLGAGAGPTQLTVVAPSSYVWADPDGHDVSFTAPDNPQQFVAIPARHYAFVTYLHGRDHPREQGPPGTADRRVATWHYQVDYEADVQGVIHDGAGADDLASPSGFPVAENDPDPLQSAMFIDDAGVWGVRVTVAAPEVLRQAGPEAYWEYLRGLTGAPPAPAPGAPPAEICAWQAQPAVARARELWRLTTMQFSPAQVQAAASDASPCAWRPQTSMFHYYEGVRVPPVHGRVCVPHYYDDDEHVEAGALDLGDFPNPGEAAVKRFQIEVETMAGPFRGGGDPPNWLGDCGGRAPRRGWR